MCNSSVRSAEVTAEHAADHGICIMLSTVTTIRKDISRHLSTPAQRVLYSVNLHTTPHMSEEVRPVQSKGKQGANRGTGRPRGRGGKPRNETTNTRTKPPLTHFISLPIGHHASLRTRISAFTSALVAAEPTITGLDPSIVISPRRLHLTLGVMSLNQPSAPSQSSQEQQTAQPERTLARATELLRTLRPKVLEMLDGKPLNIGLERMDIMPPERGDAERAHVLWVGPDLGSEDGKRLKAVCKMIQKTFMDAGLVVDERRELKIHCTVINTTYRKPRGHGRVPFSYKGIRSSKALSSIVATQTTQDAPDAQVEAVTQLIDTALQLEGSGEQSIQGTGEQNSRSRREKLKPLNVSLGSWTVGEIQICKMGSYGSEGEYVAEARCSIVP
ncbi:hypothetical protein PENSPDRAFT_653651 [Peniophora sp. CONT]|nr:hypothetical protein PENSPDRAFT_653651 [Peniophora sp. CONT]